MLPLVVLAPMLSVQPELAVVLLNGGGAVTQYLCDVLQGLAVFECVHGEGMAVLVAGVVLDRTMFITEHSGFADLPQPLGHGRARHVRQDRLRGAAWVGHARWEDELVSARVGPSDGLPAF